MAVTTSAMAWDYVGGVLQVGGTVIGTARSAEFRTREGRLKPLGTWFSAASTP